MDFLFTGFCVGTLSVVCVYLFRRIRGKSSDDMHVSASFGVPMLASWALSTLLGSLLPTAWLTTHSNDIVSLHNKSAVVEGNFFLGIGDIEGKEYYTYYHKLGDGFRKEKVSAYGDNFTTVTVYEHAGLTKGKIEVKRRVFTKEWMRWIAPPPTKEVVYEFHIPEGSIRRDFVLE